MSSIGVLFKGNTDNLNQMTDIKSLILVCHEAFKRMLNIGNPMHDIKSNSQYFQLVFTGLTLIISIVSAVRRKDAAVGSSLGITNLLGIATPVLGIVAMYTGGTVLIK